MGDTNDLVALGKALADSGKYAPKGDDTGAAGFDDVELFDAEPMPEDDGAALLTDVYARLRKYVVFADEHQAVAVTLWIVATHGLPAWQHATRLIITSPQKRCGKSRLLDIIAGLVYAAMLTSDVSTAAIFRSIGDNDDATPTLLVDEADTIWGTKSAAERNEDLRGLFNSGFQRGRPTKRCVGPQQTPTDFNTFAMAGFAAIKTLPDTIVDRGVSIQLKRRAPGETVARFRARRDGKQLDALRDRITAWVREKDRLERLTHVEPGLPESVEDRAQDAWEPLVAIADEAGGDMWPVLARAACRKLSGLSDEADNHDDGVLLLSDIHDIFADNCTPFLSSEQLVHQLRVREESPWAGDGPSRPPLSKVKLASLLKPFGIKPGFNAAKTTRGYTSDSFDDAFKRYLRQESSGRPRNAS